MSDNVNYLMQKHKGLRKLNNHILNINVRKFKKTYVNNVYYGRLFYSKIFFHCEVKYNRACALIDILDISPSITDQE